MGIQGLPFSPLQIPFSRGLSTKGDARAQEPPALDLATDVEFDDIGGLRTRKPFTSLGTAIAGTVGGIVNLRRVVANGAELLCFTQDSLYSYQADAAATGWVFRGTHLAVSLKEQPAFVSTGDQIDADRAELNGVVFFAWTDAAGLWVAAKEKTTGAVLAAPTLMAGAAQTRPRLIALQTSVILFNVQANNELFATSLDPRNPVTSLGGGVPPSQVNVFGGALQGPCFDVVQLPGADTAVVACQHAGLASYDVALVPGTLVVTTANKARTCDGPIAISPTPDAAKLQIVRGNGTNVQGDLLDAVTLADIFVAQPFGVAVAPINQIAAAHRSVQNAAQYRCYAFWSSAEHADNTLGFSTQSNWVDTGNAHGAAVMLAAWTGVGSRAFDYNGQVYVWLAFGQTSGMGSGAANVSSTGQFQNAYYLYRDDAFLCAKAVYNRGGGLAPTQGRLPGVQLTSGTTGYTVALTERRIIELGAGTGTNVAKRQNVGYAMRAPHEVAFTFDDNAARRAVRLGRTLYVPSGEVLQYDGAGLYEVGFHTYPWYFDAIIQGPGAIANGTYGYKSTRRWDNAQGEIDRSTTALIANATMVGGPSGFAIETISNPITHKTQAASAEEIWRTVDNPGDDSPFYEITSLDPSVLANPNRYLPNVPAAGFNPSVRDALIDASIAVNQANPENGGYLENLAPPAATIAAVSPERLFLAGVAGQPDTIWYSKQRADGEVAAFNDALAVEVPAKGGDLTGLAFCNGVLIAFRQRAIYQLPGDGFDNTGGGANYGPARSISTDVGAVNADAIALAPFGLIFKSTKGWYRLGLDLGVQYIGAGVAKFDAEDVLAVHVVEAQHQIRCITTARTLVYDYLVGEWAQWTLTNALHACLWQGSYVVLTPAPLVVIGLSGGAPGTGVGIANPNQGPIIEAADFTPGTGYGWDVETAWIKPAGLQGRGLVRLVEVLGEFRSACAIRIRIAINYQSDGAGGWLYVDDKTWVATPAVVGGPLQFKRGPKYKRCEAMKIRLTVYAVDGINPPAGEAAKLTGLLLDAAPELGPFSAMPATQKA